MVVQRLEIVRAARRVVLNGAQVPVAGRAFDVMLALYERRERVVGKNELLDIVWPDQAVDEANIHVQVSMLRKVLGRAVIATVPGRGYQWTWHDTAPDTALRTAHPSCALSAREEAVTHANYDNNLPPLAPALIGRDDDIKSVAAMLTTHRWIALLGTGGIGKTRLALAVLQRVTSLRNDAASAFEQGVWWIDLSDVSSATQLPEIVARGMNIAVGSGASAETNLLHALARRRALLVMDNCERWVAAVTAFLPKLLAHAPHVRVLCTSQQTFDHPSVRAVKVQPLYVAADTALPEVIRQCGAMQLLLARATRVDRRFTLPDEDVLDALALCRELDGIPLALEMAAARLPLWGAKKLRERLGDRIKSYKLTHQAMAPRQHSLQATLAWSYGLLNTAERDFLNMLALYQNGFPLDAIADDDAAGDAADDAADDGRDGERLLGSLIDKSMVHVVSDPRLRYRLLESTRLHAQACLTVSGALPEATRAHLNAMKRVASRAHRDWRVMSEPEWMELYWPDYLNLDAAFAAAHASDDAAGIAVIGEMLFELEEVRGVLSRHVRERTRIAYAMAERASGLTRASLLNVAANGIHVADPIAPRQNVAAERLQAWREVGDAQQIYAALVRYALECAMASNLVAARNAIAEFSAIKSVDFPLRIRMFAARLHIAVIAYVGDDPSLIEHNKKLLRLTELWGAKRRTAITRLQLADCLLLAGEVSAAVTAGEQAVAELEAIGQMTLLQIALTNLCSAFAFDGQIERAQSAAKRAFALASSGNPHVLYPDAFALVAAVSGHLEIAARLIGAGDAWYCSIAVSREPVEARIVTHVIGLVDASLGQEASCALREEGRRLEPDVARALIRDMLDGAQPQLRLTIHDV